MSGHHDFDHAAQEGNLWLRKLDERLDPDNAGQSYLALRATLQVLRDRLTPEQAVHLSAQLPMAVRGMFFEGWKMSRTPTRLHSIDDFCDEVAALLPASFTLDVTASVAAVFDVIWSEVDPGETAKIIEAMPRPLHKLWPAVARRA